MVLRKRKIAKTALAITIACVLNKPVFSKTIEQKNANIPLSHQAIQLLPDDSKAYYDLGVEQYDQGNLEEAIANFQKAIKINPSYAQAYGYLGFVLGQQGEWEEAIANLQRAIELEPNFAEAYTYLGIILDEQGEWEEAIANYQQAIELDPDYAQAYHHLGIALGQQWKFHEAIANFEPFNPPTRNRGIASTIKLTEIVRKTKDKPFHNQSNFVDRLGGEKYHHQAESAGLRLFRQLGYSVKQVIFDSCFCNR